jgi:hypothetical protein
MVAVVDTEADALTALDDEVEEEATTTVGGRSKAVSDCKYAAQRVGSVSRVIACGNE